MMDGRDLIWGLKEFLVNINVRKKKGENQKKRENKSNWVYNLIRFQLGFINENNVIYYWFNLKWNYKFFSE